MKGGDGRTDGADKCVGGHDKDSGVRDAFQNAAKGVGAAGGASLQAPTERERNSENRQGIDSAREVAGDRHRDGGQDNADQAANDGAGDGDAVDSPWLKKLRDTAEVLSMMFHGAPRLRRASLLPRLRRASLLPRLRRASLLHRVRRASRLFRRAPAKFSAPRRYARLTCRSTMLLSRPLSQPSFSHNRRSVALTQCKLDRCLLFQLQMDACSCAYLPPLSPVPVSCSLSSAPPSCSCVCHCTSSHSARTAPDSRHQAIYIVYWN